MDGETYQIGRAEGLSFRIWFPTRPEKHGPMWGRLQAWVGSGLVWGTLLPDQSIEGVAWEWQELLLHLASSWTALEYEETYPSGLNPLVPQLLRSEARASWLGWPRAAMLDAEEELLAFEECHDLSRAISGTTLPQLFLLREGAQIVIATRHGVVRQCRDEVFATLSELGDAIASRSDSFASEECGSIAELWRERSKSVDPLTIAEISTSMPRTRLEAIAQGSSLDQFWNLLSPIDSEPLLAAARMTGDRLSDAEIRNLLVEIKSLWHGPSIRSAKLGALRSVCVEAVEPRDQPHQQGYAAANKLRAHLNFKDDERLDVEAVIRDIDIPIFDVQLEARGVDALILWRSTSTPKMVINRTGARSRYPSGRRASLAHELCHALLDEEGAFPTIEVFGGRLPVEPEKRANAFAAEFLLPRSTAGLAAGQASSVRDVLDVLSMQFEVSHELAAWQILNSHSDLTASEMQHLRSYAHKFQYS